MIEVQNLEKLYTVHEKEPGFVGSVRSFVRRKTRVVRAVDRVSFEIADGELDLADVTALCKRIIVIDKGRIVFDGDLSALVESAGAGKIIRLELESAVPDEVLSQYGQVRELEGLQAELLVPRTEVSQLAARLLAHLPVADVTIQDPAIEEVIGELFAGAGQLRTEGQVQVEA